MTTEKEAKVSIPKKSFPAGECIIIQDRKPNGIFFLTRGTVDVIMDGEKISQINQLGSIFGEIAYFLDTVSSATIQCTVDSDFLYIENPKEFFKNNPQVIHNISKILCSRIINLSKQIAMLKTSAAAENKVEKARDRMAEKVTSPVQVEGSDGDLVVF